MSNTIILYGVYSTEGNACLGAWLNKVVADRKLQKAQRTAPWVDYEIRKINMTLQEYETELARVRAYKR